jgi:hypothetical protein
MGRAFLTQLGRADYSRNGTRVHKSAEGKLRGTEEFPANSEPELVGGRTRPGCGGNRQPQREQVQTLGSAEEIAGQRERDSVSATMQRMFLGCAKQAKRGYGDEPWLQDRRTTVYAA